MLFELLIAAVVSVIMPTQAATATWWHTGTVGGERTAIYVDPDGPTGSGADRLVVSGRPGHYSQIVARFDCEAGTRTDRFSTMWSSHTDPVRTTFSPPIVHRLDREPRLASQFDVVCRPSQHHRARTLNLIEVFGR